MRTLYRLPLRLLSEHTEHPNAVECSREINRASFQCVYDFRKYSGISSSDSSDAAVVGTVMVEVDSSVRGTGPAGSNWAPPLVDGSDEAEAATALGPTTELLTTLPEGTFKGVGEVFGVLVGSYSRLRQTHRERDGRRAEEHTPFFFCMTDWFPQSWSAKLCRGAALGPNDFKNLLVSQ